jgi:hypothetical protein
MKIKHAFTVIWDERVEINKSANLLRNAIRDATDDEATVGLTAENYIRKILPSQKVYNVCDMSRKIDSG